MSEELVKSSGATRADEIELYEALCGETIASPWLSQEGFKSNSRGLLMKVECFGSLKWADSLQVYIMDLHGSKVLELWQSRLRCRTRG